jgi:hypothetical protein
MKPGEAMALGKQFEDAIGLVDETHAIPVFRISRCVLGENKHGQRLMFIADGSNHACARPGKGNPLHLDPACKIGEGRQQSLDSVAIGADETDARLVGIGKPGSMR